MAFLALDRAVDRVLRHDPRGGASLVLGDCLEHMPQMPPASVHLIVTDPPYFLDGMDNGWDAGALAAKKGKAGVVGGLPPGMRFDREQGVKLQAFFEQVAKEAERVLCPGAFFLAFSSPRLVHRTAAAAENAGFEIRDMYAWHYTRSQQKAFSQDHFVRKMRIAEKEKRRIIRALGKRKTPQLRPQFEPILVAQKPREGTFVENWLKWETGLVDIENVRLNGQRVSTVLSVEKPNKDRLNGHLTVKPVALLETLIRLFSKEGQAVLDPFAGSGSTLLAARNTGRQGTGIEINREYYKIAMRRLEG